MNQRTKGRLIGLLLIALAAVSGWQAWHFQAELHRQQHCLAHYAASNAAISKARSGAAIAESQANRAAFRSIFTLKSAADYYHARDAYFAAIKKIDATRAKNPIPEFSEHACD